MEKTFLFIVGLISFVPLVFLPNTGQDALLIPFNIFLWEAAATSIFFATLFVYKNKIAIYPKWSLLLISAPLFLIAGSILNEIPYAHDTSFRLIAIIFGLLFFMSLFQFQASRRTIDNAIYIILTGSVLNALISFLQMLPGRILLGIIPHPLEAHAAGVFMQANILASSMATTIILAFYQISSPGFPNRTVLIKALCFISIFTASTILISTGSRIGILGILMSFPLLLISRYTFFKLRKVVFSSAVIALLSGLLTGLLLSDGALKAYSKIEKLASAGSEIRLHIYKISWEFFSEKPFFGHGIGSFNSKFHEYASAYMQDFGGAPLLGFSKFTHPHNEILLWAVEGGITALLGLIIITVAILLQIKKIGLQRGGALFSILIPISLHTQTELPFYSSNYHWLIFIFILFLTFKPFNKEKKLGSPSYIFPFIGIIIFILAIYFLSSTLKVSRDINGHILFNETSEADLKSAESNLYFGPLAIQINKRISLYNDLNNGTKSGTISYITWAERNIGNSPPPLVFHDLALAYNHVGMKVRALKTLKKGLSLYPKHPAILRAKSIIKAHKENAIEKVLDDIILPNKSRYHYPMGRP